MTRAEMIILKLIQKQAFPKEIDALKAVMTENHRDERAKIRRVNIEIKKSTLLEVDLENQRN